MQTEPSDHPHLLEWHSARCLGLVELCKNDRARKIMRVLAADLAIEAETLRREMKRLGLITTVPRASRD
jgi:hypothetical protein